MAWKITLLMGVPPSSSGIMLAPNTPEARRSGPHSENECTPCCVPLPLDQETLERYGLSLGLRRGDAQRALARALSVSLTGDPGACDWVIVVREEPEPLLALVGSFAPATVVRLQAQARALRHSCAHLRYLDYGKVERACADLAARLTSLLGANELADARFVAIPRGGLVVLGLLAPMLGLKREQLLDDNDPRRLLVVVDDCALSGFRFHQFLEGLSGRRIVFATLCSPPDLRATIESREENVAACVSAEDLRDLTPPTLAPDHRERRRARVADGAFWIGLPEPVAFPWNEPDQTLWDAETRSYMRAWRIVPPELCLKNRPRPGAQPLQVQLQPVGAGPLRPSRQTLFADFGDHLVIGDLGTRQCVRLEGSGADIWRSLVRSGTVEETVRTLAQDYEVDLDVLGEDVRSFAGELMSRGLLQQET